MPQIGPLEIAVVLLIALLVFGPNRLPDLARQAGGFMRELRKIQSNLRADLHEMMSDDSSAGGSPPPTLPPKAGGELTAVAGTSDDGLWPTGVPTSGSGADAGPSGPASPADADITDALVADAAAEAAAEIPPPPPPEAD